MTQTAVLPVFEGDPVQQAQVRIVSAGDGLSEALKIAPESLHLGEEVFYVLRGIVTQINHRQTDDDEPVIRVHTVKAHEITKVDGDVASKMLAVAAEELERLKAEAAGQLARGAEQAALDKEARD